MFRHVVMFRFKEGTSEERKAELEARLRKLPGEISQIRRYDIGNDAGIAPGNHEFVVVADFDSADDYLVYRDHPVHQAVIAEAVVPIVADRVAVQYVF
ncbi:Dabb family protein [Sphaerisporangium sp. TRM90804]|uniref:Dabb family protein n=1 Tax=Sphaerisporangium sp. TRM90804 TaxID=3031113 RepID=UPI00244D37F2|nr:Dabb family protein [Sphaerisporangium sp. TRM90804]MDH2429433.1 Dabb family protein [Sphaerisporangium sp. TRM90804]